VFLEKSGFAIHVRTIEHSITIDLLILECDGLQIGMVRICIVSEVVLVGFLEYLCLLLLVAFFFVCGTSLIESGLKSAKLITEVAEDVGAADLYE
jgi:hypothetical protein